MSPHRPSAAVALAVALGTLAAPVRAQALLSGKVSAFSKSVVVDKGQVAGNGSIALPPCPSGQQFLLQSLTASPDPLTLASSETLPGAWSVITGTYQHRPYEARDPVYLTVWGRGPVHASVALPGGQPTYAGKISFSVLLKDAIAPRAIRFYLHFSGACDTPTVAP
jgi:hypothetical protein